MEFFHVLNRGVDKRKVVMNDDDRQRFVRGLYLFNDRNAPPNAVSQLRQVESTSRKREKLVYIHAWCLMDNHYHLLVSPINDDLGNLSLFMKKLNMGYARFFNEKYGRTGALWQGKYKKVYIERDAQFQYIPFYIHLNPLDYSLPEWRKGSVKNPKIALDFLRDWVWSSYNDYTGSKRFSSIIDSKLLKSVMGNKAEQTKTIKRIITNESLSGASLYLEK